MPTRLAIVASTAGLEAVTASITSATTVASIGGNDDAMFGEPDQGLRQSAERSHDADGRAAEAHGYGDGFVVPFEGGLRLGLLHEDDH